MTKKTLYFDSETINILEKMPMKKQSDYARKAIKDYFYKEMSPPEIKEQIKEAPKPIPKIQVRLHNA